MQDWKRTDKSAGLENAGLEIDRQKVQPAKNVGHIVQTFENQQTNISD